MAGLTAPGLDRGYPASRDLSERIRAALVRVAEDLKAAMDAGEIARAPIDETLIFAWGAWQGVASMVIRDDGLAIPADAAQRALIRGRQLLVGGLGPAARPLRGRASSRAVGVA